MNKYSKLQATLKALAHPAIGINSIALLKFIVEAGQKQEFTSSLTNLKRSNWYQLYSKLDALDMFEAITKRTKHKPARQKLSSKGREVFDSVTHTSSARVVMTALTNIQAEGFNRLNPLILMAVIGEMGTYTRDELVDDPRFSNELFIRNSGLTETTGKVSKLDNNGKTYKKGVYAITKKGELILSNLIKLV